MKSLTLILALALSAITWSCGGGEKAAGTDSTKGGDSTAKAPVAADCPEAVKNLEAAFAEYNALIEKVKAGEEVTKEAEEAAKTKGSDLNMEVTMISDLSEDCKKKVQSMSWAEAHANMAEARAKAGK